MRVRARLSALAVVLAAAIAAAGCADDEPLVSSDAAAGPSSTSPLTAGRAPVPTNPEITPFMDSLDGAAEVIRAAGFGCTEVDAASVEGWSSSAAGTCDVTSGEPGRRNEEARIDLYGDQELLERDVGRTQAGELEPPWMVVCARWTVRVEGQATAEALAQRLRCVPVS